MQAGVCRVGVPEEQTQQELTPVGLLNSSLAAASGERETRVITAKNSVPKLQRSLHNANKTRLTPQTIRTVSRCETTLKT